MMLSTHRQIAKILTIAQCQINSESFPYYHFLNFKQACQSLAFLTMLYYVGLSCALNETGCISALLLWTTNNKYCPHPSDGILSNGSWKKEVWGKKKLPLGEIHWQEICPITFSAANLEVHMLTQASLQTLCYIIENHFNY